MVFYMRLRLEFAEKSLAAKDKKEGVDDFNEKENGVLRELRLKEEMMHAFLVKSIESKHFLLFSLVEQTTPL